MLRNAAAIVNLMITFSHFYENERYLRKMCIKFLPLHFRSHRKLQLWEQRYLHPDYFAALNGIKEIYQPCPDVYHYPLMSTNFTEELIEEMEHYGQWSSGQNKVYIAEGKAQPFF